PRGTPAGPPRCARGISDFPEFPLSGSRGRAGWERYGDVVGLTVGIGVGRRPGTVPDLLCWSALTGLVGEVVRIGLAELDVDALVARDVVLEDAEYGLRAGRRHFAVGAEDGQLVLGRGDIELGDRKEVVGRHLGGDL